jgi:hypothetical protein
MRFQPFRYIYNLFFPPTPKDGPNYRFVAWTEPKPVPTVNMRNVLANQGVVKHALAKYLLPWDYDTIVNGYFMPLDDDSLVYETMTKGDLPDHRVPKDIHYYNGRRRALELLRPPWLTRPVHFNDLRWYPWNKRPSAEEPYTSAPKYKEAVNRKFKAGEITNHSLSTGNLLDEIFVRTRDEIHDIKRTRLNRNSSNLPFMYRMNVHAKATLTKTGQSAKTRLIYGVPKLLVMIEAMFFWSIINYHKYTNRENTPLLWPYVTLLGGWYRLNHDLTIPYLYYNTFVTVDWSGFDFHALFSVVRDIQDDWRTLFDFESGYIPTKVPGFDYTETKVDPERFENLWEWMCAAQLALPHRMPDGSVWIRLHRGIPSGLWLTQWLDSHYNLVMMLTILDRMGIDISTLLIKVQGDDSITAIKIYIPANQHADFKHQFAYYAKTYFDAISNEEKSDIRSSPQGCEVLGYANNNGMPDRNWHKLLAQLLYPRARRPTYQTLMARAIGITYADCDRHPQVRLVCQDVYDYLASKGYSPNAKAAQDIGAFIDLDNVEKLLDHFPSQAEVNYRLRSFTHFSQESRMLYWPAIFLSDH